VLAGVRGPSPQFDGECVEIERMNDLHCSKIDDQGSPLDEIGVPTPIPSTIEGVVEAPSPRLQRQVGFFDTHPERCRMRASGNLPLTFLDSYELVRVNSQIHFQEE